MDNSNRHGYKEYFRTESASRTADPTAEPTFIGPYIVFNDSMKGGQATVWKARKKTDQEKVFALKKFSTQGDCMQTEIEILERCTEEKLKNVVELIEPFIYENNIYIALEFAEEGDLSKYLSSHPKMNLSEKVQLLFECADGLRFLHNKIHVVHCDIKPGNILLKRDPKGSIVPKIADFGTAKIVADEQSEMTKYCGTSEYCAPEMFAVYHKKKTAYDKEVDIFSLGLVSVCVLRNKENPYSVGENKRFKSYIMSDKKPKYQRVPMGQLRQEGDKVLVFEVEETEGGTKDEERELKELICQMTENLERRIKLTKVIEKLKMMKDRLSRETKSTPSHRSHILVAAMEIGPTTMYAFSFITSKADVRVSKVWDHADRPTYRVPTSVLTDEYDQFLEFGFSAEKRYVEDTKEGKICHLYRFGKDLLKEGVDYETMNSVDGHSCDAYQVYLMVLTYLKKHMISTIGKCISTSLTEDDIKWVIIIPSAWGLKGKKYITNSLAMYDMCGEVSFENKMVMTDMEAASVCCLDFVGGFVLSVDGPSGPFRDGDQLIIINAWDEHMDIGVYSRTQRNQITELHKIYLDKGKNNVTKEFVKLLEKILSPEFVAHMQSKAQSDWTNMLVQFDKLSHRVASHTSPKKVNIPLPSIMGPLYQQKTGKSVELAIQEAGHLGVQFSNGMLLIKPERVGKIFEPAHNLVSIIHTLLTVEIFGFAKAKAIFLVGSFAESKYLQELVQSNFANRLSIRIPIDGSIVAVKGAVQAGHQKDLCVQ